jgi:hypothetical protein
MIPLIFSRVEDAQTLLVVHVRDIFIPAFPDHRGEDLNLWIVCDFEGDLNRILIIQRAWLNLPDPSQFRWFVELHYRFWLLLFQGDTLLNEGEFGGKLLGLWTSWDEWARIRTYQLPKLLLRGTAIPLAPSAPVAPSIKRFFGRA